MATSKIPSQIGAVHTKSGSSNVSGTCNYSVEGHQVTLQFKVESKGTGWTVFAGMPLTPQGIDPVYLGTTNEGHPVYIVRNGGQLQIRTSTISTIEIFSGSYICE
jgi:hypothetical protein